MTDASTPGPARRRTRTILSLVFGLLGVIGVLASVFAVWAHEVVFDSSKVGTAVDQALLEPEVTDALAAYLTDQILAAVPVEQLIDDRLPSELTQLSPILVGGARTIVDEALTRVLDQEATRRIVSQAAEESHKAAVRVLRGDGLSGAFTVDDATVSLNLLPILSRGLEALQETGLLANVDLPTLERGGDPTEQIASLEEAIGRPLPVDFGQLVVYESAKVGEAKAWIATAQQAVAMFERAILLILGVTVVSLIACVVVANRRRRALITVLLGTVAAMGIGRAVIRRVVDEVPTLAIQPGSRAALRSMVSTLASGLLTAVTLALVAGLVLALIAVITNPTGAGAALRGRASSTTSSLGGLVAEHRDGTAIGAAALALLVITLYGFGTWALLLALGFVGIAVWAKLMPERGSATPPAGA